VYQSKLLFPAYDENEVIQDILLLRPSNDKNSENEGSDLGKNMVYCLDSIDNKSNEIFITDTLIDSLALTDVLGKPSIVIKSVECLNIKVLNFVNKLDI
jgi:hypothetical protein